MRFFLKLIKGLLIFGVITGVIVTVGVLYYMEFQLPDTAALNNVQLQVPLQIFTRDGKLIAEYGEKRRIPLPFHQIPTQLIQAVLATEDQRYFQHPGVDLPGLVRAGIKLIATGRKEQGGSTITMQVARSFYLKPKKTFGRKLREILLALKIDHSLSKQKILELYLNKIFLGARAYGVEAAAQIYYGKHLNELSLDQYAMLAGLPKAPSALNPITNPKAAQKRRNHVLARMLELKYIDEKTYQIALSKPLNARYHELQMEVKAPYVAELIRQQLQEMYGDLMYTEGYKIYTTIDSHLQDAANKAVRDNLIAYDQRHGYRGPEGNLGIPSLQHMEQWEHALNNISPLNDLEPAAVIDISPKTVTALRANGSFITIPWEGLSWARRQLNEDYLGPFPHDATDILKLGDLIRIISTQSGWRLAQIPKAEAGLVALNPLDGRILALVGGFDYQASKFNRITNANRQPGSSFKPFIYSAALEKGYTLATVINDAPIVVENSDNSLWRPQNAEHRFYGPTRLRDAITKSRNLVSIRLLDLIGIPYAINFSQHFGFTKEQLPRGLSLALGTALVTPLQMASAYAIFANTGFKIVPFAIESIYNQSEVIYQAKPLAACPTCPQTLRDKIHAPRVISPQNAFLITSALQDVIQEGTGRKAQILQRSDLAGKTGTTNKEVDAWFVGFNSEIVTVAWIGFDQEQRSLHEYGSQAALPMWVQFMREALNGTPQKPIIPPTNIVSLRIDPLTGKPVSAQNPVGRYEYFMLPFVPSEDDNTYAEDMPDDTRVIQNY